MAILHKNISAEGDIHNPKWFSGANNGDVAWRNELGVLESTDELVLPAALDFVDGSVAPPTSNSGDIYVLSSGASVNAGWGTVSLGDWVRYDGTTWNVITPQKSSLCYNETTDALNSYDGSTWSAIGSGGGGASIYTDDDTIGTGRVATLTDTLDFSEGNFNLFGLDKDKKVAYVSGDSPFTNSSTFVVNSLNFKHNTNDNTGSILTIDSLGNQGKLNLLGSEVLIDNPIIKGDLKVSGNSSSIGATRSIEVPFNSSATWKGVNLLATQVAGGGANFEIQVSPGGLAGVYQTALEILKDKTVSLLSSAIIKGKGTSTGSALAIYDNDTTPNKLWDFLDNGDVNLGGNSAVNTGNNTLTIDGSGATTSNKKIFVVNKPSGEALSVDEDGDLLVNGSIKNGTYFGVEASQTGYWYHGTIRNIQIGKTSTSTRTKFDQYGTSFFSNSNIELHRIGLTGGGTGQYMSLFKTGFGTAQRFLLGGTTLIGSEDISLQGDTLLNAKVSMPNLPTSATGLATGDLWNDGGTVKIA